MISMVMHVVGGYISISSQIANGIITSTKLADSAVTEDKIAANAVTTGKIADGTIVNADISSTAAIALSKVDSLAGSTTLGADNATISVTGLDLNTDEIYLVTVRGERGTTGGGSHSLQFNADTTATNYWRERSSLATATYTGTLANDSLIGIGGSADEGFVFYAIVMKNLDGNTWAFCCNSTGPTTTINNFQHSVLQWTSTANVTSIQFITDTGVNKAGSLMKVTRMIGG